MTATRERIHRRRFMQMGAVASSGVVLAGCASGPEPALPVGGMRYRPLGRTGLKVSEISFGAHGVDNQPMVRAALDAGINTFCTSGSYLDGLEEESIGRVVGEIGSRRDDLVLITGEKLKPGATGRSVLEAIEASVRRLRTDRVEIFYVGDVRSPSDLRMDAIFEGFEAARSGGKALHLGVSGHSGGMERCLEAAVGDGRYGMLFFKYDFVSYPEQDEILRRAGQQGVGTIVFKTNAGVRKSEVRDLQAGGLSFRQASWRWALGNPDVASVAVTVTNYDLLRECVEAVGAPLTRAESRMLRRYARERYDGYCRFCGACEDTCPRGVAIADVMRFAMYFSCYGREEEASRRYRDLDRARSAAGCAACPGPCEGSCPFGRKVRTQLLAAHGLLGSPEA